MTTARTKPSPMRLRRLALGLTLEDVAASLLAAGARVGTKSAVARWETGVPVPSDVAPLLARVLRVRRLP